MGVGASNSRDGNQLGDVGVGIWVEVLRLGSRATRQPQLLHSVKLFRYTESRFDTPNSF